MKKSHYLALLGLICLLPTLLAITSGLFGFSVPLALISPVVILPGLLAAFAVAAAIVVRVRPETRPDGGLAAINVRVEAQLLPLAVVALGILLAGILATYLFVENFRS